MTTIMFIIGSISVAIFTLICKAAIASIKEMQNPDLMFIEPLNKIDNTSETNLKKYFDETNKWTKNQGLKFAKYIDFSSQVSGKIINTVFWINGDRTLTLVMYYVDKKVHYDFISKFENNRFLTTSSSKEAATLPTFPESLTQYFPGLTLNEIWKYHSEAERFIERKHGYSKVPFNENIILEVKKYMLKQTKFITNLFLWQLRGPYWFFVRRNIVSNKRITEK